jgi:glycine cleavage system H protein
VKAASEVYAPVAGEVTEVNATLEGAPATVNEDAQGKGWFLKLKLDNPSEVEGLMTEEQYKEFLATLS